MKKYLWLIFSASMLWAITDAEKRCIEEKRQKLNEKIEECRKRYSDAKEVSICAHSAKQEFANAVKQCYEQK